MLLLDNPIRDYAWGHPRRIPEFIGRDWPADKPAAELWMGAHPSAPSRLVDSDREATLDAWIAARPVEALGPDIATLYQRLPFLFKLLAAGRSLSIQAHPDKATAEAGFRRENEAGIPRDAPRRNYRDDNHKPEIIMALTPFTAMIGFRGAEAIRSRFHALPGASNLPMPGPGAEESASYREFLSSLLTMDVEDRNRLVGEAVDSAASGVGGWDALQRAWVPRLAEQFPGDIGVLAPLFLNVVEIQPGEALYQPARTLHAYLDGFGVELMANSDNVLRGGLTPKNVDVPELLSVLDFRPSEAKVLKPPADEPGELNDYATPAREFALGVGTVEPERRIRLDAGRGPAIVLVLDGRIRIDDGTEVLSLERGGSVFIPHGASELGVGGRGRIAVAEVPR